MAGPRRSSGRGDIPLEGIKVVLGFCGSSPEEVVIEGAILLLPPPIPGFL
jgi:hypothetical protein